MNTILYQISTDQSTDSHEILANASLPYRLERSSRSVDLILTETIARDREDHLVLRFSHSNTTRSSDDLHVRLVYAHRPIESPRIFPQTIEGYVPLQDAHSPVLLGPLLVGNHSHYPFVFFRLDSNEHAYLKQLSGNHTELYLNPVRHDRFQLQLTAMAINDSLHEIDFHDETVVFLPPTLPRQTIDIHLRPISRDMLDQTVPLAVRLDPQSTYDQWLTTNLSFVRRYLAERTAVDIHRVHVYATAFNDMRIELLLTIDNDSLDLAVNTRFMRSDAVERLLKGAKNLLFDPCHSHACETNGSCTSSIHLQSDQYERVTSGAYRRLLPKYRWNLTCIERNESRETQDHSPCSSDPCLATERCIERSAHLYACQCNDAACYVHDQPVETNVECLNRNSPLCRGRSMFGTRCLLV